MHWNYKPGLNELLERSTGNGHVIPGQIIERLTNDSLVIDPVSPFVFIENFSQAKDILRASPIWLAYGGPRTASTYSFILLNILIASLTSRSLSGWEGDFQSPGKFFEIVRSSEALEAGVLKIHRICEHCNDALLTGAAKAVISTRDYPSIAASYRRMRRNRHSPFFGESATNAHVLEFIEGEISVEKEKRKLQGCLFIKESAVQAAPHQVILAISRHLGIAISGFSVAAISEATSKRRLREIQCGLTKNSTGHDKSLLLHFDHIGDDDSYDQETRDLVLSSFGDQLDEDGYLRLDV